MQIKQQLKEDCRRRVGATLMTIKRWGDDDIQKSSNRVKMVEVKNNYFKHVVCCEMSRVLFLVFRAHIQSAVVGNYTSGCLSGVHLCAFVDFAIHRPKYILFLVYVDRICSFRLMDDVYCLLQFVESSLVKVFIYQLQMSTHENINIGLN